MNRSELELLTWSLLGARSTDRFFTIEKVDTQLNLAHSRLVQEMQLTNPDWFRKKQLLNPDVALTGRVYSLATQSSPIVDFSRVLVLKVGDAQGRCLEEVRDEYLDDTRDLLYSIVGPDEATVFETSLGVDPGRKLYLKYEYNSTFGPDPSSEPAGIPAYAHPIVAFDAAEILFSLGAEGAFPDRQATVRNDMKASLFLKIGRRSMAAVTTREE